MANPHDIFSGRLAVVDLLFSWPLNGGADVDLYHVVKALNDQEVSVKLFVLQFENIPGRGQVNPADMPFPVEMVCVPEQTQHCRPITESIRNAVDAWQPDVVWLAHGYALKPHVALALTHYPLVGRYYAHEMLCARNGLRFKENNPCPHNIFDTPEICRPCALNHLGNEIRHCRHQAWTQDYLAAEAYSKEYYETAYKALEVMTRIVVSNEELKQELGKFQNKTVVIPGGISLPEEISKEKNIPLDPPSKGDYFPSKINSNSAEDSAVTNLNETYIKSTKDAVTSNPPLKGVPKAGDVKCIEDPQDTTKTILISGRVDDPLKGLQVLLEANALLKEKRSDFQIVATHFDPRMSDGNFVATGWLPHEQALELVSQATICVVPSLWHEPFGLVAVEAMMAGKPVCASDTGGLRDIVVHGETGYLFPIGDSTALATYLETLLDDAALRESLSNAGRERAVSLFTWENIITSHYLPLLKQIMNEKESTKGMQVHE